MRILTLLLVPTALVLIFILGEMHQGCYTSRISRDFMTLGAALVMYQTNTGRYPSTKEGLDALVHRPKGLTPGPRWKKIMDEVPLDPWQEPYGYLKNDALEQGFGLISKGPDQFDNGADRHSDDIHSWDDSTWPKRPGPLIEPAMAKQLGTGILIFLSTYWCAHLGSRLRHNGKKAMN